MARLQYVAAAALIVLLPSLATAGPVLTEITPTTWTISGITDGTSNTIQFGETTSVDVCVPQAAFPAGITDGTSNTIQFTENASPPVSCASRVPVVSDGTQRLNGIVAPQPVAGTITDANSNTLLFGKTPIDLRDTAFDVCFSSVRVGSVRDGSSNTIQFWDTAPRRCYDGLTVGATLDVTVPGPGASSLVTLALAVWTMRRRRQR